MKTLKVKSILFSLLAMMAVAVFLTSCEQSSLSIEEDFEMSLIDDKGELASINSLSDNYKETETEAKVPCPNPPKSGLRITNGSCTSIYAYSYYNPITTKEFILYDAVTGAFVSKKTSNTYYVFFGGLQPNRKYYYRVRNVCSTSHKSQFVRSVNFYNRCS